MTLHSRLKRGFTLIELSIVLVVIGLLAVGGFAAINPILESTKRTETRGKLEQIEKALTLWVMRYECLPCPADVTVASGDALFGIAQDGGGVAMNACQANALAPSCQHNNMTGVPPWESLGLSRDEVIDGWGNFIHYRVDVDLTEVEDDGLNGMVRCQSDYPDGGGGSVDFDGTDCNGSDADSTEALTVQNAAGDTLTDVAAYVLVSFGPDGSDAYNSDGVIQADKNAASVPQNENSNADTTFVMEDPVLVQGATYFDDMVRYRTAPMVIMDCGEGSCGNP